MDLNQLIAYTLRAGVLISAFLGLTALTIWVATGSANLGAASGSTVGKMITSAVIGNVSGLIYLGVLILIATPVFRVALSTVYFARQSDKLYVLITLAVLSMLIFALLSGAST